MYPWIYTGPCSYRNGIDNVYSSEAHCANVFIISLIQVDLGAPGNSQS